MTPKNVNRELIIRVLSVEKIGLAEPKGEFSAIFPCTVRWTGHQTDKHIALIDDSLNSIDEILVESILKSSITEGVYRIISTAGDKTVFTKQE